MTQTALAGIKACVFDAYGTLFDFASAAKSCGDVLGDDADRLTALWRDKQLQYTWLRAVQGRHAEFWQVTGEALDYTLETLGIDRPGLRDRLMALYLSLDAFPEVPEMLRRLKAAGMRTAILSNGSPPMLDAVVKSARLGSLLDAVPRRGVDSPLHDGAELRGLCLRPGARLAQLGKRRCDHALQARAHHGGHVPLDGVELARLEH